MSDLYMAAYWGSRREGIDRCAARLSNCLRGLAACDQVFGELYKKGSSRRNATRHALNISSTAEIIGLLEAGRDRTDYRNEVMEELGYHVSLWNGKREPHAASLNVTCGLYAANRNLSNSVVVNLPESLGRLSDKGCMLDAFTCILKPWEPEWGGVISTESRNRRGLTSSPFVDWMLYLKSENNRLPSLPQGSSLYRIDSLGWIVVTQDTPIDPNSPNDVERVRAIEAAIWKKA